jgi:ribonuclease P protein component
MAFSSACAVLAAVRSSPHAAPKVAIVSQFEVTDSAVGDQGFRDVYRLRKTDEYSSVFAFRRVLKGRLLTIHYRPNLSDTARLGVVVAKKLARRAVDRNLVKRVSRETFRLARKDLPSIDMIVRLSAPIGSSGRGALRLDLLRLLERLPR